MAWFKRDPRPGEMHFYAAEVERHLRTLGLSPFAPAEDEQLERHQETPKTARQGA